MNNFWKKLMIGIFVLGNLCVLKDTAHAAYAGGYIPDRFSEACEAGEEEEFDFFTGAELPSYYRTDRLPAVRNQKPYGTCWAFSTLACCEINMILNGYADEQIDLSEMHLIYFSVFSVTDPLGGLAGDERGFLGNNYLKFGGNYEMSINAMADWLGAVDESVAPYEKADEIHDSGLDDALAYADPVVRMKNYISIPMSQTTLIKRAIQEYGAVGISYYHADGNYKEDTYGYYSSGKHQVNHAVTIVGWDDDYEVTNFKSAPADKGAWIVRNSWGKDWGKDGYFYLSYYDSNVSGSAVAFEAEPAKEDEHNYQYDGVAFASSIKAGTGSISVANIFTAHGNPAGSEEIRAVSFEVKTKDAVGYTVKVYTGLKDGADPESGKAVWTEEDSVSQSGLYTIELPEAVSVEEGEKFSVVLQLDGGEMLVDYTRVVSSITQTSSAEEGQSFLKKGGAWEDYGLSTQNSIRLKAYTKDSGRSAVKVKGISLDKDALSLDGSKDEAVTLKASVLPENADDRGVIWTSSDPETAAVDENGCITVNGSGRALITATAHGNQSLSAVCEVTCRFSVKEIRIPEKLQLYAGESASLAAAVLPENATDRSLKWSSSNAKIAVVDAQGNVTAKADGDCTVTAVAEDGSGIKAVCAVNVRTEVSRLSLDRSEITLHKGQKAAVAVTVIPENATDRSVVFSSSNPDAVAVDENGMITAVRGGTSVITVTAADGQGAKAECTVKSLDTFGKSTGLCQGVSGEWLCVQDGMVLQDYTGLWNDADIGWWYVEDGKIDQEFNGFREYGGAWWCICSGKVMLDYTGLWGDPDYGWWYVEDGCVRTGVNGLKEYGGAWWCVCDGKVIFDHTGLWGDPELGWWYVEDGAVKFDANGLEEFAGLWWCVCGGRVAFGYTGLWGDAELGWWYVEDGAVKFDVNGLKEFGGLWWCVCNGQVRFDYTGQWSDPVYGSCYVENGVAIF